MFPLLSVIFLVLPNLISAISSLNYSQTYNFTLANGETLLQFSGRELKLPPRVSISSNDADLARPLMVVAREPQQQLSWQLPLVGSTRQQFNRTSRTLCHDVFHSFSTFGFGAIVDYPVVSVATASLSNVTFSIRVDYQEDFIVTPSVPRDFDISPSEPRYFFYNFTTNKSESDSNYDTVVLKVTSNDSICMTVSIQNVSCPIFDTNADITFNGFYETVHKQGGITIPKYKFPYGFYAVFVAKFDDSDCTGVDGTLNTNRTKHITLTIEPSITYQDYVNAVLLTMVGIGTFYVVFCLGFCICSWRRDVPRQMPAIEAVPSTTNIQDDNVSLDESEYDTMAEADDDKMMRLSKSVLYLSDLARKSPAVHKNNSYLYLYNVLTIALFYGIPVIQLVITYQRVLNETGQQDLCYYNFLCAHPLLMINDFNHLFSNAGYILLGLLFIFLTCHRETTHKDLNFDRQFGIPQHYGMFYAMGVALIMEGVLSGSYHICPNKANFQFDSSFMYVMAVLCMVKLYQNRHPDINATAYSTFGVLAISILLGMIGILEASLLFWIIFTVIYILACFYLSAQVYYMGCCKFDRGVFMRVYRVYSVNYRSGPLNVLRPLRKARMILLVIGNLCNWALAFWGIYGNQEDFAIFLLAIFMANTLLYFFFYIAMKFVNKERVNRLSLFFLVISVLCASASMYFFLNKSINWKSTPAESRVFNQECKLWSFYDYHDIWHFLSAVGMFFTFMVLLTLDDDLSHTDRTEIVVF